MNRLMLCVLFVWSYAAYSEEVPVFPWAGTLPFNLPWMNSAKAGTTFSSVDHPAGIFVVEAYFLNCPYCNTNAPNVDELVDKYANEPRVHVLDVGVDRSDSDYQSWISKHRPNHPVLKDSTRKLIGKLGTAGYPSTYVIDCRGNVVKETSGEWNSSTRQEIQSAIDALLKQECYL